MHVAIAGGGVFGQVIAWRLALRGARVTLVEPVGPGGLGSGSGDRTRLVRALYDEPFFAESGFHGLRLWDEWQRALDVRLFEKIGVLYLVRREGPGAAAFRTWVTKGIGHVRALGAAALEMTPAAVAARWPAIATEDLEVAAFEPGGGYVRAALATRAIARAAAATGLVTHVAARAVSIDERAGRACALRVRAAALETSIAADAVVVAAGFAGLHLVEPLCGCLPILRLAHWTSYWDVPYPEGAALHQTELPAWADLGAELYGFPDDGESGFKAASHSPRPLATPPADPFAATYPGRASAPADPFASTYPGRASAPADPFAATYPGRATPADPFASTHPGTGGAPRPSRPPPAGADSLPPGDAPTDTEIEILRERTAVRFPALRNARCRGTYACAYDATSDERFQIGPVPGIQGVWFVGGLSGHGFKHAPSLGDSIAAAVLSKPPLLDLAPYALRTPR